jgi:hypothetical protein
MEIVRNKNPEGRSGNNDYQMVFCDGVVGVCMEQDGSGHEIGNDTVGPNKISKIGYLYPIL